MKKIIGIFILISLLPIKANALTGNITISCKDTIKINEEVLCQIEGNSDEEISSIHAEISTDDGLTIEAITKDESWEGDNDKILDLYTADNKKDTFKIATIKIKSTKVGTYNINLKNIILGDKNFEEHKLNNITKSITITSENESSNSSSSKPSSSSSSSKEPTNTPSISQPSSSIPKVDEFGNITENPKTGNRAGFIIIILSILLAIIVINKKRMIDMLNK